MRASVAASLDADGVAAVNLAGELDNSGAGGAVGTRHALHRQCRTAAQFGRSAERTDPRSLWPNGRAHGRALRAARAGAAGGGLTKAIMTAPHSMLDERGLLTEISIDAVEDAALSLLHAGGLQ